MTLHVAAVCIAIVSLAAPSQTPGPNLVPYADANLSMQIPRGWAVQVDFSRGTARLQQDPNREDSPHINLNGRAMLEEGEVTEDEILDSMLKSLGDAKVISRRPGPKKAGKQLLLEVERGGKTLRVGTLALVRKKFAFAGTLVAEKRVFDALGGMDLIVAVGSSVKVLKKADAEGGPP